MALRKYPWEEWFGRSRTVLIRGTDYHISTSMMYQTIKNNIWRATLIGVHVRVTDTGAGIVIDVTKRVVNAVLHSDQVTVACQHKDELATDDTP